MSARKDGLQSYYLVGRFPHDNSIWLQPLTDSVPQELGFIETLALMRLCTQASSIPVATIRCRQEGDRLRYYHSHFSDNPTHDEIECLQGALLRIAVSGTGHLDPDRPYASEAAIEDTQTLGGLGVEFGGVNG